MGPSVETVDWKTTAKVQSSLDGFRQRWLAKHSSGFCGVGKMLKAMNMAATAKCPRCDEVVETAEHVWVCQGDGTTEIWEKGMERLRERAGEEKEIGQVIEAIIEGLSAWRQGNEAVEREEWPESVRTAVAQQNRIGWRAIFEGRPAVGWSQALEEGTQEQRKKRKSGRWWVVEISKKLIGVAWDLWTHRNEIVHKEEHGLVEQEMNAVMVKLRNQVVKIDGMGEFTKSAEDTMLQWPSQSKNNWITVVTAALIGRDMIPDSKLLRRRRKG
jgi:hypothetical protein